MEDMNMEINAAAFYGMYGDKLGRRASSMTALMTEQEQVEEQEHEQEQCPCPASREDMMTASMCMTITPPLPRRSSLSSYSHGHVEAALLSAAAMFHAGQDPTSSGHNHHHHHSKHLVGGHFQNGQLAMNEQAAVISNSSLSSPKMEASSNHMEFDRKVAPGRRERPCWPEPSLVVRSVSQSQSQSQSPSPEAMVTPLEIMESASSTNPKDAANAMKSKIAGHPHYPHLLAAYLDCQKIGAPPEVVAVLEEMSEEKQHERHSPTISIGADPELDQFMEAYCEMLKKHQVELDKPYKEGMAFINKIETQLNSLNIGVVRNCPPGYSYERDGRYGSSEEELSCGEADRHNDT
ncbi:hypothetical protein KI387_020669 [Taxus chinensis]|uniref:Homeobox transcription factor KN2 n=1 Tax=Taxus chinensis TaxID=29808 RepID=A0AA38GCD6_TAXCH|nr:hypothetical protein KI387_020669 [Taxus chinensis]